MIISIGKHYYLSRKLLVYTKLVNKRRSGSFLVQVLFEKLGQIFKQENDGKENKQHNSTALITGKAAFDSSTRALNRSASCLTSTFLFRSIATIRNRTRNLSSLYLSLRSGAASKYPLLTIAS